MITHIRIQNFRSFMEAEVDLQPFSLVVGANGSGKSNLLKFFAAISSEVGAANEAGEMTGQDIARHKGLFALKHGWVQHQNGADQVATFAVTLDNREVAGSKEVGSKHLLARGPLLPWQGKP